MQVIPASINLEIATCPAGYVLQRQVGSDVYVCKCNYNETNIVHCDDDQIAIAIKVNTIQRNVKFRHYTFPREASGQCMLPIDNSLIWSSMTVQWATVDALSITKVQKVARVSTCTPAMIQTSSAIVIERVRGFKLNNISKRISILF